MQLVRSFIAFLLSSFIIFSCSDNKTASTANNSATASLSNDGTYDGKWSLTYTIDGKRTAIKDYLHKDGKNYMALYINSVTNDEAHGTLKLELTNELTAEFFKFRVVNKGTTNIPRYNPSIDDTHMNNGVYLSHTGFRGISHPANFYADSVTVTINSIDASHVTGNFSGNFITDEGQDGHHSVMIADGSFDVPIKPEASN